jgi:hypothetical protein
MHVQAQTENTKSSRPKIQNENTKKYRPKIQKAAADRKYKKQQTENTKIQKAADPK